MVIDLLRVAHVKLVPRTHHATNAVKVGFSCEMVAKTFADAASSMKLKWAIKLFFGIYIMMSSQFYGFSSQWCVSKNAAKRTASVFP